MIGIFYGSSTLNTEYVAQKLHNAFGREVSELHNVADITVDVFGRYEAFVLVTSTWGMGDLQDDWERLFPELDSVDWDGKPVGLVGLGDQENYPDHFCDSIFLLYEKLRARGADMVGSTATADYKFKSSRAVVKGAFVGLVIDEDNQSDKTDQRVRDWVSAVKPRMTTAVAVRSGRAGAP